LLAGPVEIEARLEWHNAPIYPYRGPVITSAFREYRDSPFRKDHSAVGTSLSNEG